MESDSSWSLGRLALESLAVAYGGTAIASILLYSIARQAATEVGVDRVWFIFPAIVGFASAYMMGARLNKASCFTWIAPLVPFMLAFCELANAPHYVDPQGIVPPWPGVWAELFGTTCGETGCLYQLLATVPLVCAAAYSASAFFILRRNRLYGSDASE